ncbi:hypothetical protein HA520_07540 [Azotobacter chroococcum]|uniref:Lipoprotein n=1 Tax=Azotobacter chroococcum TaxID=353 RepID=A0AA43Z6J2_9GAMM|nr:hypothetical protein [Azotobacter chroococcum]NHN77146.1 hypothetical protein [Azotobacter chroococcum]
MRVLILFPCLLTLGGCNLLLPRHDPGQAWIELNPQVPHSLRAAEVDRKALDDHRFFQVSPGAHELGMRYRFEVSGSNIGPDSAPYERNCLIRLNYKKFTAGQRYSLEVGDVGFRAWARLYDDQRRMVASGRESGCSSGV